MNTRTAPSDRGIAPTQQELELWVKECCTELIRDGKSFTAQTVIQWLKLNHPNYEIHHQPYEMLFGIQHIIDEVVPAIKNDGSLYPVQIQWDYWRGNGARTYVPIVPEPVQPLTDAEVALSTSWQTGATLWDFVTD